jgi:pyruvate kinase
MAAYRGKNPIFAQCYSKRVLRELMLSYGIVPHYMEHDLKTHKFLSFTLSHLVKHGNFNEEDLIIVLAGHFGVESGPSYIDISTIKNMMKRV